MGLFFRFPYSMMIHFRVQTLSKILVVMKTFSHYVHVNVGFIRTNAVFCTKTSGEKMSDFGENYIYGYGF